MITNLVNNALIYTPPPGEVTLRCGEIGGKTFVEVEDTGPGIPPEFRERVFERFFRLPAASSPGGGLGLPIVREIARGFGGRVDILTPVSRKGALLRVTLPPVAPDA